VHEFNPLGIAFEKAFENDEDFDRYLIEFGYHCRLREGQRAFAEVRDFYQYGPSSLIEDLKTFGGFIQERVNEKHPALKQVLGLLLKNISHHRDQRHPMGYALHMLLMRMRGKEDRERGDGSNPKTTACVDILLFHYIQYCKLAAERKSRKPTQESASSSKAEEEKGVTAGAREAKDPRFPRRKARRA